MKPTKQITLGKGLDWEATLNQYDNGDGQFFYQIHVALHSDTGACSEMTLGLEGDFDPYKLGEQLVMLTVGLNLDKS